MPNWKKVILSGSNAHLQNISASGHFSALDGGITANTNSNNEGILNITNEAGTSIAPSNKLGVINFIGTGSGTLEGPSAIIQTVARQNFDTFRKGSSLEFYTANNGDSGTPTTLGDAKMIISESGVLVNTNSQFIGDITASSNISASGNITTNHITASGNISASGTIIGTDITASGNISASGTIHGTTFIAGNNTILQNNNVTIINKATILGEEKYQFGDNTESFGTNIAGKNIILETSVTASSNISASGTFNGISLDGSGNKLTFANGESIDNNTNGTINITAATTNFSGDIDIDGNDIKAGGTTRITLGVTNTITGDLKINDLTPRFIIRSSDGSIASGETIGEITFGDNDVSNDDIASIKAVATEDHSDNPEAGTKIEFSAEKKQEAGRVTMLTLDPDDGASLTGKLSMGTQPTTVTPNTFNITHTAADGDQGIMIIRDDTSVDIGDLLGGIGFDSRDGNVPISILEASAYIAAYADQPHSTIAKGGRLEFGVARFNEDDDTVSSPVLSIEHSSTDDYGKVGINDTTPGYPLDVKGNTVGYVLNIENTNSSNSSDGIRIKCTTASTNTNRYYLRLYNGSTTCGSIRQGISSATTIFNESSDRRLKTDIKDSEYSVEDLMKIKIRDFKWKADNVPDIGVIAQELNEVLPNLTFEPTITDGEESPWEVNYGGFIPYLIKSIQDQQHLINDLQNQINELKTKK